MRTMLAVGVVSFAGALGAAAPADEALQKKPVTTHKGELGDLLRG